MRHAPPDDVFAPTRFPSSAVAISRRRVAPSRDQWRSPALSSGRRACPAYVLDLLTNKFSRLGRRRFPLTRVLLRALDCFAFWHSGLLMSSVAGHHFTV